MLFYDNIQKNWKKLVFMVRMIAQIRKLFTPRDKKRLLGISLLMALAAFGEMLGLGLLIGVIAFFLNPELLQKYSVLNSFWHWTNLDWQNFVICGVVGVALLLGLKNIFALFVVYRQSKFIYEKQTELLVRLYRSYLEAPYRFSLAHPLAERSAYMERADLISQGVLLPLMQTLADVIVIFALGVTMFCLLPLSALGCFLVMVGIGFGIFCITRSANSRMGRLYQDSKVSREAAEYTGLAGIKTVKSFCKEVFFCRRFEKAQEKTAHSALWLYTLGQIPRLSLETVALFLLLGLFIVLLLQGKKADEILLVFSVIVTVMARILPALSRCNYNITLIRQHQYLFESIAESIFAQDKEELGSGDIPLSLERTLEIRNLCFSYDGSKRVIDDLSLTLNANESLGISGRTGCGKTTLADLLLGLLKPDSGMIAADGTDVFRNLCAWRGMIGYVSQNVYVCSGSLRENVAFGLPAEAIDDEQVWQALEMAQIADWAKSVPGGLDYVLHDSGSNLSGGQRQRIGIARALYPNPKLLILDEATSALDNETESAFVEALEHLNGKLTMVVIAHRLSTIEKCTRHIRL